MRRLVSHFGEQAWRSPAGQYYLFDFCLRRYSYIKPECMAYQVRLVLFGYEINMEFRRKRSKKMDKKYKPDKYAEKKGVKI